MAAREILTVLFGLLCLGFATKCPKQKTSPGREVLCYTSTFDVERLADSVCRCTSLVHRGQDVRNLTTSGVKSIRESLKEMNPALQFVISVDDPAGTLKTSATTRQEAVARLMRIIKEVDGLELNVTAGSKERLFHFVKGLKDEIERKSYEKRIFMALPTTPEDLAKQFDLKELSKYVDLFTVATHYLVDEDEAYYTFHPSRLMGLYDMLNTDSLVDLISGLGAPKRKILVTVPASAYKFTLKDANDTTPRSPTVEKEPVVIDRKELCESMNKGEWTVERDEDLTAPYSFSNTTWIAFEDKVSAGIKGKYVLVRDLAGLGVQDVENDMKTNCEKPLTHEIHHSFMDLKRKSRGAVLSSLEEDIHQARINYPSQIKSSGYRVVRVVDTQGHIRAVRENTQTEFTCNRQGYFVHPKSCNRFYRCVKFNQAVENYSVFEFDCPAGLAFDERTEVCVWPGSLPQGSACPGSSEIPPVARVRFECPAKPGYYADPQNCRWFFACIDLGGPELMAFEFRCPYGLVFDEHKFVCEWPWLVPSCSDSGSNYARTEYNIGPHSVGSTSQGVGAYVTGGLPVGYSGSTGTGYHGTSGVKYSESTAGGYSGSTTAGSIGGYSTVGGEYSGSSRGGYSDSTQTSSGSYSGGIGGYSTTGGEYSGFTGSSAGANRGSGYSGGSSEYSGSVGTGYTGSTAGSSVHAGAAGGSHVGGTQFSGSTGGGSVNAGSTYSGSSHTGGTKFSGSTGVESTYSGSTVGGHVGGTQFSGSTGAGSIGGSINAGSTYSGSSDGSHIGGAQFSGSTGGGGSIGGQVGGTQFSVSTGAGSIGGFTNAGSTYSGSTGGVYSSSSAGSSAGGFSGSGYTGSTSGVYSGGVTIGGHVGSAGTGYSVSTGSGYPGSTINGYQGSTGIRTGDTRGFAGSTSDEGLSSGIDYSGATGGISYTGSTGGIYTQGATGGSGGYAGSIGSTVGTSGSSGAGYSGTVITGSAGTTQVTTGLSKEGYGRPDYSGSSTLGHGGSSKSGVAGSSVSGTSYVDGSTPGTGYVGGSGVTTGYLSPGVLSGSAVTGISNEQTIVSGGGQYSGTAGSRRPVYSVSVGAEQTSKPIYPTTGAIGSGAIGSGVSETQGTGFSSGIGGSSYGTVITAGGEIPGITLVDQPPSVSYISGSKIPGSTVTTSPFFTNHQPPSPGSFSISNHPGVPTIYLPGTTTGSYDLRSTTGKGTTSGTTYYGSTAFTHGYDTGSITGKPGLNVTIIGSGIPSTTYEAPVYGSAGETAGTGTIITGNTIQGTILTDDSSSGTVISHGNIPGSVTTGSSDRGTILTGVSQPGFVKTETGSPGYVVSDGVKTIYPGSASPGVAIHGIPTPEVVLTGPLVPGTIIKGESTPGLILAGQTSPGVSLGGSVSQGTVVGGSTGGFFADSASTTYHGGSRPSGVPGLSTVPQDTGYKTTEYYDNGGRGTIRFNNGHSSTKYGETDIPDYRTSSGVLPEIPTHGVVRINDTGRISFGTTLSGRTQTSGASSGYASTGAEFTPSGFTKTGPTKTGITTASLGGKGTYITGSGQRPKGPLENIGEKAFDGTAGYTKSSEGGIDASQFTRVLSTVAPGQFSTAEEHDISHIDTSRVTLGPGLSPGYSFDRSRTQFGGGIVTASTPTLIPPTENGVFAVTTPAPHLNVEIYSTPGVGDKTYPEYGGKGVTTVGYVTGPLDGYKTTVLGAAGVPVTASTVRPVIDTGYKTVVSSTPIPVPLGGDGFTQVGGGFQTGSAGTQSLETETYRQRQNFGQGGHVSVTTPSTPTVSIASEYSPTGFRQPDVSVTTENYGRTGVTKPEVQYLPGSTVSSIPSTSEYYKTSKTSFGYGSASSTVEGEQSSRVQQPEIQYLPATTVSPPVGVTYGKPFTTPGITYGQPTSAPPTGGSPTRIGIPRDEVEKLITNYDRGTIKYTPSIYDTYPGTDYTGTTESIDYSRKQSSSSSAASSFSSSGSATYLGSTIASTENGRTYEPLTITTYSGGYSKPSVTSTTYELGTRVTPGKGKVIVKWSDLHPLLLGKLGAECTCKADPFATLRGPGKKLIASSKGQVDLNNYDESDVYVDLGTDYDSKGYEGDRVTSIDSTSTAPFKVTPLIEGSTVKPANTYLPSPTTAPEQTAGRKKGFSGKASFGGSASFVGDNVANPSVEYSANLRAGKKLHSGAESLMNRVASEGATFGGLELGSLPGAEEVLDGTNECARSGLFRHPNFCNKFYACHWDEWKKKFTLHVFNCPVHLTFDSAASACNWPSKGPACQGDNLLV